MAKLQIAVDLMTEEQAALLADEIHDVIDIFEVGTPMIVRDGLHPVRRIKEKHPELTVLADRGLDIPYLSYRGVNIGLMNKVGLRSVSAPVRDASGEVRYAIGVVGMFRQVYSEDFLLATRLVCEAGSAISRAIGYRP